MSESLTEKADIAKANRLHDECVSAAKNSVNKAIEIGRILVKFRSDVRPGDWGDWQKANLRFSETTAWRYMLAFEKREQLSNISIEDLADAYKFLSQKPQKKLGEPIQSFTVKDASPDLQGVTSTKQAPVPGTVPGTPSASPAAPARVIDLDETGFPIPETLLYIWGRRSEIDKLIEHMRQVKLVLERAMTDGDKLFIESNPTGTIAELTKLATTIACAKPFAVCSTCQGHPELQPKGDCPFCRGKGFVSKFRWTTVPENLKRLRQKAVTKT